MEQEYVIRHSACLLLLAPFAARGFLGSGSLAAFALTLRSRYHVFTAAFAHIDFITRCTKTQKPKVRKKKVDSECAKRSKLNS